MPKSFQQQPQLPHGVVNQAGVLGGQVKRAGNPQQPMQVWGQTPQQVQQANQRIPQQLGVPGGRLIPSEQYSAQSPMGNPTMPGQFNPITSGVNPNPGIGQLEQNQRLQMGQLGQLQGQLAQPRAFKKGGSVKKTGYALVHKGEKVLTKKQQQSLKSNALLKKLKSRE